MTQKCEKNLSTIYYLDTHYIIFVLCCTSETVSFNKFPSILLFSLLKSIFKQFFFQHVKICLDFYLYITCCIQSRGTCIRIAALMFFFNFWPPLFLRFEVCWQVHMHCALSHLCLLTQTISELVTGIFWRNF